MNPKYDFAGQVALVTGASSGMGFATARAFAEQGAIVALADVNESTLRTATDELTDAGHRAVGVVCDVADEAQVGAVIDRTVATFGRLDMAFNNAGIMIPPSDAADEPAGNFDRVNAINLRGVWACMKHELRQMRAAASAVFKTPRLNATERQGELTRAADTGIHRGGALGITRYSRFSPSNNFLNDFLVAAAGTSHDA